MTATVEVTLDEYTIPVMNYKEEQVDSETGDKKRHLRLISFDFKVTGKQDYHDVTVLLYKRTFDVRVPAKDLAFRGTIHHYSTSIPNADDDSLAVDFKLGLIEV